MLETEDKRKLRNTTTNIKREEKPCMNIEDRKKPISGWLSFDVYSCRIFFYFMSCLKYYIDFDIFFYSYNFDILM